MNRRIKRIAFILAALGSAALLWAAMLSDGGAPLRPVLLLAAPGLAGLLAGAGLRYLCSPEGKTFRQRFFAPDTAPAAPSVPTQESRVIPFPKAS
ncbi:MAG: hypothetical protein IJT76_04075 [Clostridia bacterium]|nr:hypothetical protein [Clostridia bacterium]